MNYNTKTIGTVKSLDIHLTPDDAKELLDAIENNNGYKVQQFCRILKNGIYALECQE